MRGDEVTWECIVWEKPEAEHLCVKESMRTVTPRWEEMLTELGGGLEESGATQANAQSRQQM